MKRGVLNEFGGGKQPLDEEADSCLHGIAGNAGTFLQCGVPDVWTDGSCGDRLWCKSG